MNNVAKKYYHGQLLKKQQGNILVMFTIGLFAFIAMMALALDGGHLLLNKTRLQNFADSSALHSAVVLDLGGTHHQAREAVVEMLSKNLAHADNFELKESLNDVTKQVRVDFSMRADPFISSVDEDAHYVKVEFLNVNLSNFFADLLSFNKRVSAKALAGPSTAIVVCPNDVVPMMVCGDFSEDGPVDDANHAYGLPLETLYVLKSGSSNRFPIGPGSFQLLNFDSSNSAEVVSQKLAGASFTDADQCSATMGLGDTVALNPGDKNGPSSTGINTRLGVHDAPMKGDYYESHYPRDWNTCRSPDKTNPNDYRVDVYTKKEAEAATEASTDGTEYQVGDINPDSVANAYRYRDYINDETACYSDSVGSEKEVENTSGVNASQTGIGASGRRILKVVIGDCTGKKTPSEPAVVKGIGCFFLTQTMNGGSEDFIIGEFAYDCSSVGKPSGVANDTPGPYTIVLYHVPGSKDS